MTTPVQRSRVNAKASLTKNYERFNQLTSCYYSVFRVPLQELLKREGLTQEKYFLDVCRKYAVAKQLDLVTFVMTVTTDHRKDRSPKFSCEVERREAKKIQDRKASLKKRVKAKANTCLLIDQISFLTTFLSDAFVLVDNLGQWIEPLRIVKIKVE